MLASGARDHYFGNDQWARVAPALKTVEHALEIRHRVFTAFERAEMESDPTRREHLMRFVIVGAGPTAVELAGAIAELAQRTAQSPRDISRHLCLKSSQLGHWSQACLKQ